MAKRTNTPALKGAKAAGTRAGRGGGVVPSGSYEAQPKGWVDARLEGNLSKAAGAGGGTTVNSTPSK